MYLEDLLAYVGRFSVDICIKYGTDKCKISSMDNSEWVHHEGYEVDWNYCMAGVQIVIDA